jgi:hypothetical protein
MTVGNATRLGASQRSTPRRCVSHHIATQRVNRWGTPGGSRAFSADGHPQAPVLVAQSWAECITSPICPDLVYDRHTVLFTQQSALRDAESYGDCLTHPVGHYELWERLRALPFLTLKKRGLPVEMKSTEYEHYPLGRVVYEKPSETFVIYADARLQVPEVVSKIMQAFQLEGQTIVNVRSGSHYRTRSTSRTAKSRRSTGSRIGYRKLRTWFWLALSINYGRRNSGRSSTEKLIIRGC